jgi:hypothetical protein
MAYMFIRVNASAATIAQMNARVGDSTNPHEGVNKVINLLTSVEAGCFPCEVDVYTGPVDQTLTTGSGGTSATYVLT